MTHPAIPHPEQQTLPSAENLFKIFLLIVLVGASFYAAARTAAALEATATLSAVVLKWSVLLLLGVVDSVLILGLGILAHDAVHRVLFRSAWANELGGSLISMLALLPFYANRQFHLTHHSYAHQPGADPENVMHQHSFLFATAAGAFIGLKEQYRILFENILRLRDRRYAGRALKDAASIGFAAAVYFWWVPALGMPVTVTFLPMFLMLPVVFSFRALSDHYGIPAVERDATHQREVLDTGDENNGDVSHVTGWVVITAPWLEWLWSHVNYHEVHHKYPYLSHRYLPQVFAATRVTQPYLVVRGYWRSLVRLRKLPYYSSAKDVRAFRTDATA